MPFRSRFDCLWCGTKHAARSSEDLEGWASLCPDCLARAQENGFLRSRLRAALRERSAALGAATAEDRDAWYLREGRFSRGPLHDVPWQMELDEATRWLDGQELGGIIVELEAGTGWWSPLLAGKGELWLYEADRVALERARRRLVAHGLVAHLHATPEEAAPPRPADALFAAFALSAAAGAAGRGERLAAIRRWLRPGGTFLFVELGGPADRAGDPAPGPGGPIRAPGEAALRRDLEAAGFELGEVTRTASAFLMGRAQRRAGPAPGPGRGVVSVTPAATQTGSGLELSR